MLVIVSLRHVSLRHVAVCGLVMKRSWVGNASATRPPPIRAWLAEHRASCILECGCGDVSIVLSMLLSPRRPAWQGFKGRPAAGAKRAQQLDLRAQPQGAILFVQPRNKRDAQAEPNYTHRPNVNRLCQAPGSKTNLRRLHIMCRLRDVHENRAGAQHRSMSLILITPSVDNKMLDNDRSPWVMPLRCM